MLHDLLVAIRRLRNAPGFTVVSVLTLALAIGANTAVFSVADTVLFKPLPYADPDRVYVLGTVDDLAGQRLRQVKTSDLEAIEAHSLTLGHVGLRGPTAMTTHRGGDRAEWMETFRVAPDYFRVLGVHAARGRLFEARDFAEPGRSAILTYESWQRRFGGDETLVGRSVMLGTQARDVIGVLPAGFVFPTTSLRFLYTPTGRPEFVTVTGAPWEGGAEGAASRTFEDAVVRLEPGVTREQAQAELDALTTSDRKSRVVLESARSVLFPTGRPIMWLLVGAASLVLLLGCANLANLLLGRTRRREREIGLQAALGATRVRIVRPIAFETLIVGLAAAVVAIAVTRVTFDLLLQQVPPAAYGSAFIRFDARIAVFALTLGVLSGLAFAVIPAWSAARLDMQTLVRGRRAEKGRGTLGQPLTALQVALAVVLVFGAIVAVRAFVDVLRVPLGFSPEGLIAINVRPNPKDAPDLREFYVRAVRGVAVRGDVLAAGAGESLPTDGFGTEDTVTTPGAQQAADVLTMLPGYFEALGVPIVRGRSLTWDDLNGDAAVLSESAARVLFGSVPAVGAVVRTQQGRLLTVVGIARDAARSVGRSMAPPIYVIPAPDLSSGLTIVARVRSRGPQTLDDVRGEIASLVPRTPVTAIWWSDAVRGLAAYRTPRFQTVVLGTFSVLALVLTALGIFAAVTFAVASRTREMGVRLALGARPARLIRMMVREALSPVLVGLFVGILSAMGLAKVAEATLVEVHTRSPLVLVVAALLVMASATAGAYWPARLVARVDPANALRAE